MCKQPQSSDVCGCRRAAAVQSRSTARQPPPPPSGHSHRLPQADTATASPKRTQPPPPPSERNNTLWQTAATPPGGTLPPHGTALPRTRAEALQQATLACRSRELVDGELALRHVKLAPAARQVQDGLTRDACGEGRGDEKRWRGRNGNRSGNRPTTNRTEERAQRCAHASMAPAAGAGHAASRHGLCSSAYGSQPACRGPN